MAPKKKGGRPAPKKPSNSATRKKRKKVTAKPEGSPAEIGTRRLGGGALLNASPYNAAMYNQPPGYFPAHLGVAAKAIEAGQADPVPPAPSQNPDPSHWSNSSFDDAAAQIAASGQHARTAVTSETIRPPLDVGIAGSGASRVSSRAELALTPQPVTIVPTPYPTGPTAPLVVHGALVIDVRSAEFREFSAKLDDLVREMRHSNEIAGETRDQLIAELQAGRDLLIAPKADRKWVDALLVHPLKWLAEKAGSAIVGGLALEALKLLLHMLSGSGPIIPT
jgi:hypothetical protein